MKLLIVDDEYHVIRTVRYLLRMSCPEIQEILEAGSARDAICIIEQEHPEILITDVVMTDATGLELMKYLKHTSLPVKVIVISGYNNFEYIRETLRGGGVDYLLKPIDADQLAAAVRKAVEEWEREDSQKKQTIQHLEMINSMSAICKETLLYRLLTQPLSEKTYQELLGVAPGFRQCRNAIASYYDCRPFVKDRSQLSYSLLTDRISALNRFLEEQNMGLCFFGPDDGWEVFLFLHRHTSDSLRLLETEIESSCSSLPIPLTFGRSRPLAFPLLASEALTQAKDAFFGQDIFSPSPPMTTCSHVQDTERTTEYPALERELFSALITGNEKLIDQSIEFWIQALFPGPVCSLHHGLAVIDRFLALMEAWRKELTGQYPHLQLPPAAAFSYCRFLNRQGRFSLDSFRNRVKMEMAQLSGELTSPTFHPQNDVIYQIAHYIRLNYDKPFSQFACAQLFFINKNYMCRKFKNTFHVSMISYLNQIRIDRAKELLEHPGFKIKDVANLVGFEDEKYFSRQFHRTTGMSPNEYRGQAGSPSD